MLPRTSTRLLHHPSPTRLPFSLSSSCSSAAPTRLLSTASTSRPSTTPSSARRQARPYLTGGHLLAQQRPFTASIGSRSAKRDWENQAGGKTGADEGEAAEGEQQQADEPTDVGASSDHKPSTTAASMAKKVGSFAKESVDEAVDAGETVVDDVEDQVATSASAPAAVHEGVLPPPSSSADAPPPSSPASSSSSPSTKNDPASATDPASTSPTSSTTAKIATKARSKAPSGSKRSKAATAAASSSSSTSAASGMADDIAALLGGERGAGGREEKRDLPEYSHTLVLPVTSSMLPPYRKNFTFTEPAVIRAVRALASARIDQLGVFLLHPPPSTSTSSAPPKVENVDVVHSLDEVHKTGLLCRIKSSRPGTVSIGDGGEEVVRSWNVELEPVRRIVLSAVEVGKEVEGEVVKAKDERAEAADEGEGEVASFEKIVEPEPIESPANGPLNLLRQHAVSIGSITHVASPTTPGSDASAEVQELQSLYVSHLKDWAGKSPQDVQSALLELSHASGGTDFFHRPLAEQLDIVAGLAPHATNDDRQAVLDALTIEDRLKAVLLIMKKELYDIEVRSKIHREMKAKLDDRQKEMILGEQMRAIRRELGHDKASGKDELVDKLRKQAEGLRMPVEVDKTFEAEMSKLAMLDQNSSEFNVVRNYLDWIVSVPWGKRTVDSFSIPSSTAILNEDHYGLTDVKDRILEFLAVGKLRGTVEGKILCLVGPPGVGKTSIAKSIARALERRFYRISVGGLRDVAEIKGHRRTYVAAMPGKAVQALKQTQAENPLILIDEIDKMSGGAGGGGGSWGGDPSSALLEMLDPEQNGAFTDHYLDLPVDLSKVLFVCTANMLSTIPAPLLDRMEVLEVSGYVSEEKRAIAQGYLKPQAKTASGLAKADVELDDSAVDALIQYYCRESGVRNLKKHIEKIYRKAAFKIVQSLALDTPESSAVAAESHPAVEVEPATEPAPSTQGAVPEPVLSSASAESAAKEPTFTAAAGDSADKPPTMTLPAGSTTLQVVKPLEVPSTVSMRITKDNLKDYVGPPVFQKDRIYPFAPPPGVSNGLGYTGNGAGALMPIEITVMPGKGSIQTTGKLGDVIKESVTIAISYLRANAFALGIAVNETDIVLGGSSDRDIHLHMPEGAIGKDGPSAGVAILTALVSLMTKTRVDPDIAMTGEISLGGQVLPVGGLKEKILAAHRASIKKLIVPRACQGDIEENVHASVKDGIDIVYVENVREVLYEVFGQLPVAESWKDKYPLLELYGAPDGTAPAPGSSSTITA